jgi:hypothetical protein
MFQVPDAPKMHQELHNSEVPQNSCFAYPLYIQVILCGMSELLFLYICMSLMLWQGGAYKENHENITFRKLCPLLSSGVQGKFIPMLN